MSARYTARRIGGEPGAVLGWTVWDAAEDCEWEYDPDVEKQAGVPDWMVAYNEREASQIAACLNEREERYDWTPDDIPAPE